MKKQKSSLCQHNIDRFPHFRLKWTIFYFFFYFSPKYMANVWIHDVLWSEIFTNVRPLQVLTTRSVHTIYDRRRKDRHSRPDFTDHKNTLVIFVTSYNKFLTTCVRSHLNNFNGIITPVPKKQSTFNERLSLYTLPRILPINLCSRLAWLYHNKFYDRTRFERFFLGTAAANSRSTIHFAFCQYRL